MMARKNAAPGGNHADVFWSRLASMTWQLMSREVVVRKCSHADVNDDGNGKSERDNDAKRIALERL